LRTSTAPAEKHKSGLPQLNVNDFAPQLVWLALTFGVLYWLMSRIALPRIADIIEARNERIANDIDSATQAQKKAKQAEIEYEDRLKSARERAHSIAQEKKEAFQAETQARQSEVESQIAARMKEAEERIEAARKSAMNEVRTIAADASGEILRQLLGQDVSAKKLAANIDRIARSGRGG
jgi:F-type H+-transporting ATPase subunit b